MASGWRLKPLHRLIVLSQTYQRSSAFEPQAAEVDPENTMLWRHRQQRLEAEVVRDSILAVSGQLNTRMTGPGFYPTLPAAVLEGQSRPGQGWGKSDDREQARRSVLHLRQAQSGRAGNRAARRARYHEQLRAEDRLDHRAAGAGVPERRVHPRPGAALRSAAGRRSGQRDRDDQVELAFALALCRASAARGVAGRPRVSREARAADQSRDRRCESHAGGVQLRRRALEAFCLVVLNTNEFVYSN